MAPPLRPIVQRLGALLASLALIAAACGDDATRDDSASAESAAAESTTTTTAQVTTTISAVASTTQPETTTTTEAETTTTSPQVGPGCDALTPGVVTVTMDSGGADHEVRVFVPTSFAGQQLPAVVNWHGLGSNGGEQATYSGYETVAESEGFIVVHPTGVPSPGDTRNSWQVLDEQDPERDDLAFAIELFDVLTETWCVDGDRIFSTGMSNGGFFTARLVCEIPERLAGAISVAGIYHPEDCAPSTSVPFLAFHGTNDEVVPFDGSGESSLAEPGDETAAEFFSQVMPDEFAEFAADAGCGAPTETAVSPEVIRYDYPDCGVEMAFFEVVGGGHTWPGSPLAAVTEVLGFTTDDVSATIDGWSFFESLG